MQLITRRSKTTKGIHDALCVALISVAGNAAADNKLSTHIACRTAKTAEAQGPAEWWIDLSLTPAARVSYEQRNLQTQRIRGQQDVLIRSFTELGIKVTGRVQIVRNALAIHADAAQLKEVCQLPGVRGIRLVTHTHRTSTTH
jgi:hypothetical protein